MRFKIAITASAATALLLAAGAASASPVVLTGDFLKVGISDHGTFGSDASTEPGILHDPTGTQNFYPGGIPNDYLTPGTPHDGFAFKSDQTGWTTNDNDGGPVWNSPVLLTGAAALGYQNAAQWIGNFGGLTITNTYLFNSADEQIKILSTLTNNTGQDLTNLYFGRSEDPDPDVNAFDTYATVNTLGDSVTAAKNLASAAGANTGLTIGILNGANFVSNTVFRTLAAATTTLSTCSTARAPAGTRRTCTTRIRRLATTACKWRGASGPWPTAPRRRSTTSMSSGPTRDRFRSPTAAAAAPAAFPSLPPGE
jgi:hypothetical protein